LLSDVSKKKKNHAKICVIPRTKRNHLGILGSTRKRKVLNGGKGGLRNQCCSGGLRRGPQKSGPSNLAERGEGGRRGESPVMKVKNNKTNKKLTEVLEKHEYAKLVKNTRKIQAG